MKLEIRRCVAGEAREMIEIWNIVGVRKEKGEISSTAKASGIILYKHVVV